MHTQDNMTVHVLCAPNNLGLGHGWEKRGSQGWELTVLSCGLLLLPGAAVLTGITLAPPATLSVPLFPRKPLSRA